METLNPKITAQAARFVTQLESGLADSDQRRRLDNWLAADPAHREAFDDARRTWRETACLRELAELEPLDPPTPARFDSAVLGRLLATPYRAAVAGLVVVGLGILAYALLQPVDESLAYRTQIAEVRDVALADGTVLTLAPKTQLDVQFTATERRVTLKGGEAFFSVADNPGQPFVVESGDTTVRVLGTRFNVHKGVSGLTVTVAEGLVEVAKTSLVAQPGDSAEGQGALRRQLRAGEKVVSPQQGGLQNVQAIAADRVGAWRSGLLFYDGISLREVVADANRYSRQRIVIISDQLYDLKVIAAFRADQVGQMIAALEQNLPIVVEYHDSGHILLKPKPKP